MFWEKLIPAKYLVKPAICGVEIVISDDRIKFYYSLIKNQNKKITISETGVCENKPELPERIKKNKIPLIICITGKAVVLKKVTLSEDIDFSEIVSQNLPASNAEDFYIQLYRQNDTLGFLCIIRKEQLDPLINTLHENKYEIADVLLGPPFIALVQPIVSNYNTVETNSYGIDFSNNCIEAIHLIQNHSEKAEIIIGDISIQPENVLSFSGGFVYLTNQNSYIGNESRLSLYRKNHLERIKLRLLSYALIGISLLVCLTNLFVHSGLFKENNSLETRLSLYQGKYEQINQLLSAYEKKKNLIEQAGILESSPMSKYTDKIASTIPREVVLTEWQVNPVKKGIEEDSLMVFEKGNIIIRGNCNKSLIINEWINVLKSQDFIGNVNLEKFNFSNEGYIPNFEIKINIE